MAWCCHLVNGNKLPSNLSGGPNGLRVNDIFSRLDTIQYMNVVDRRADGHRQQRPRIASRGKNFCTHTIIPNYGIIPKRIRLNK